MVRRKVSLIGLYLKNWKGKNVMEETRRKQSKILTKEQNARIKIAKKKEKKIKSMIKKSKIKKRYRTRKVPGGTIQLMD